MDLVLVDGPNLFNTIGRYLEACDDQEGIKPDDRDSLRSYFLDWFDMDRIVAQAFVGTQAVMLDVTLGIVIFHSNKPLGGARKFRIGQEDVNGFWARQAANPNSSAMLADIPGEQRERFTFDCKKCGESCVAESTGEKGVDSSMISYMFETANEWQSLCIFSRDVDFVPAVWALRRRGKRVFAAGGEDDSTTALGRAVQHFYRLPLAYARQDLAAFRLLRAGGALDRIVERIGQAERCWPQIIPGKAGKHLCVQPDMLAALAKALAAEPASSLVGVGPAALWPDAKIASFTFREPEYRPAMRGDAFWLKLDQTELKPTWHRSKVPPPPTG